jgi:hypothetical protein
VFRTALARNESPEAFALQAVQEAIKPQVIIACAQFDFLLATLLVVDDDELVAG